MFLKKGDILSANMCWFMCMLAAVRKLDEGCYIEHLTGLFSHICNKTSPGAIAAAEQSSLATKQMEMQCSLQL